jgi:hypothetical protein
VLVGVLGTVIVAAGNTPGPSPTASSQKADIEQREQQQIAQGQAGGLTAKQSALPNLRTPPPAAPCAQMTLPFPTGGISAHTQGGPFGSARAFAASSSWAGSVNSGSPTYAVWSGATGTPSGAPGTPAVTVYAESVAPGGCSVVYTPVGVFTATDVAGPLKIEGVAGRWLTLSSAAGQIRYFDIVADHFSQTSPTTP